jgi:hypothetical protein
LRLHPRRVRVATSLKRGARGRCTGGERRTRDKCERCVHENACICANPRLCLATATLLLAPDRRTLAPRTLAPAAATLLRASSKRTLATRTLAPATGTLFLAPSRRTRAQRARAPAKWTRSLAPARRMVAPRARIPATGALSTPGSADYRPSQLAHILDKSRDTRLLICPATRSLRHLTRRSGERC